MRSEHLVMSNLTFQREYYNERWRTFEFANGLKLARCIAILDSIRSLRLREPRIVDLGCGAGWLTAILAQFGPTLGVDLSDEAVRVASEKYPHASFTQADLLDWDYPREYFDVVVSQEVIEHLDDQQGHLELAYGLLRKGGFLILTTPNARTFYAMPKEVREAWTNQPIEKWLTVKELKEILMRHFDRVCVKTIIPGHGIKGSYRFVNSYRVNRLLTLMKLNNVFDSCRLACGYGLHTVAVAQKPHDGI